MPTIGASLEDQGAVSLNPNLGGKKKKKKKAKTNVNPNAFIGDNEGHKPYEMRKTTLANAGQASIGNASSLASQPQESIAANLPDLDIDLANDGDNEEQADWDYKDFAGAKVDYNS
jgi:hypothetical protein